MKQVMSSTKKAVTSRPNESWTRAIRLDPKDVRAYSNRSMVRLTVFGDLAGALEDARAAIGCDRLFARGYIRLEAAMRCAIGYSPFGLMKKTFGISFNYTDCDDELEDAKKHEIERAFIVKQGIELIDAVCQAAEEEGATSTAVADAKMLADMKTKILERMSHLVHNRLQIVLSWNKRIKRRITIIASISL